MRSSFSLDVDNVVKGAGNASVDHVTQNSTDGLLDLAADLVLDVFIRVSGISSLVLLEERLLIVISATAFNLLAVHIKVVIVLVSASVEAASLTG